MKDNKSIFDDLIINNYIKVDYDKATDKWKKDFEWAIGILREKICVKLINASLAKSNTIYRIVDFAKKIQRARLFMKDDSGNQHFHYPTEVEAEFIDMKNPESVQLAVFKRMPIPTKEKINFWKSEGARVLLLNDFDVPPIYSLNKEVLKAHFIVGFTQNRVGIGGYPDLKATWWCDHSILFLEEL